MPPLIGEVSAALTEGLSLASDRTFRCYNIVGAIQKVNFPIGAREATLGCESPAATAPRRLANL